VAANYSATIELIVEGQQRLDKLQSQVIALNKQIKELARLDIGGIFEDPLMGGATAKLRAARNEQVAALKQTGQQQDLINRKLESQLLNQIRLNSAVDLYKRRLNEVSRTAAPEQAQFKGRLQELEQAFQFFKGKSSVQGVQAVATELGRIVEYSREVTRLELSRVKSSQQIKDYVAQIEKLKLAGLNTVKAEATLEKFAVNAGTNKYKLAEKYKVVLDSRLKSLTEELRLQKQLETIETQRNSQAAKTRNQRIQNVALGAGFPLLFGGGPGSVLGGAAGGLVPGPGAFAAQIGLSAIGQQADLFVAAVAKTGVALTSTGKTLEFMREKALFSTTAVEDQAIALGEQGRVSELANLLTQDLARSIGGEGVKALQELGDETNQLTKEWNTLTAQLFALVAGPLKAFIAALNTVLGGITAENRLATLRREATPAQQARLAEITRKQRGGTFRNTPNSGRTFIAGPEDAQAILDAAAAEGIVPSAPAGRVTSEDRRTFTPPKPKADKAAQDAAREAARVAEIVRSRQLSTVELQRQAVFSENIAKAEMAKDPILVRQLQGQQELMRLSISVADALEKEKNSTAQLAIAREFQAKKALAVLEIELDIAKIKQQQTEQYDTIIADLDLELKLKTATTEQERERLRLEAERAKLQGRGFTPEQIGAITGLQAQVAAPLTDAQKIEQHIGKLNDEVADLTNIGNIAITVADGIGDAFSNSFKGIIDGSMTAREALAGFFQSVADQFLDMAAQIIAKWIQMTILNTILQLFPGGGGGGTVTGDFMNTQALQGLTPAANGATFANGIAKFANGGIVSSPTLFKFADGGATRTGLMGEAGPEAIMPLKRGSDGSLGVQANGLREAMNQDRAAGGGTPVLNMSFQSTNIGGVEYVSRDQLEAAMEQTRRDASRDGAQRGMTMTLDRIQNSSSTRRRIGV